MSEDLKEPQRYATIIETAAFAKALRGIRTPLMSALAFDRLNTVRREGIPDDPMPLLPKEGFDWWCLNIKWRTDHQFDAVVLITGETGSGKSTVGLRLLQHLDPTFTLEARLCYTAAELLAIYQTIKPGQGVLFDEGVRGLLAGDQMTKEQKALIQALALIREKGAILVVCAPSIWNIAKQVRQDRARFWIHVLHRGLATMHEREAYLHYVPDPKLGFMQSAHCPWLTWKAYPPNSKFFQHYREVKTVHLDAYLQETRAILEGKGKGRHARKAEEPLLPPTPAKRDPPVIVTERAAAVLTKGLQPKSVPMQATDDDIEAALRAMPVYKIPAFLHVGASRVSRVKRVRKIPDYQE